MIDINQDKKQLKDWIELDPTEAVMDVDELAKLAVHGFEPCEDYCGSRELYGQENCFCVRANFLLRHITFFIWNFDGLLRN